MTAVTVFDYFAVGNLDILQNLYFIVNDCKHLET